DQGFIVLAALISPTIEDRELARTVIGAESFVEVHCSAPLEICEARDTDRLFERARSGEIGNVTGIDAPYEAPTAPDLDLPTGHEETAVSVDRIWRLLADRGLL